MAMRNSRVAIGFMVVWLVFWGAGILVVLYGLAGAIGAGDLAGVAMMTVWLGAAGFGLRAGIRKLRGMLLPGEAEDTPRPARPRRDVVASPPSGVEPEDRRMRHSPADIPTPPVT